MKHHLHKLPTKPSNWKVHVYSTCWEIVDWNGEVFTKNKALIPKGCGGCCAYTTKAPMLTDGTSASCVKIEADNALELITMGLKPSAWRISGIGQCDAILFPSTDANGDAFLLVETKYSKNKNSWKNYKDHALEQITDTITQLSNNGCPIGDRNLFGLISCPLLDTIGASAFSPEELMDIYNQHGLSIHMGNSAKFQDAQAISFTF